MTMLVEGASQPLLHYSQPHRLWCLLQMRPDDIADEALLRTIDDLAEKLTGSREYFWMKPHSTGDRMRGSGRG